MSQPRRQFPSVSFMTILLALSALGVVLRWLVLNSAQFRIDYDEAMIGLQAVRILRGQFAVFLPGQPYLGNLESYLLAADFAVFGSTNAALKLVPLLLCAAYIFTTGLLGRAAFGARVGLLAALFAAIAPAYLIVVGTKAWGGYIETLVGGNLLLWLTLRLVRPSVPSVPRWRDFALLGLVAGVMFWISWLIAFYAIPAAIVLLWHVERRYWRGFALSAVTFFVGSLPFWIYNVQYPAATFKYLLGGEKASLLQTAPHVLKHFATDMMPRLVSGDPTWHVLARPLAWLLVVVYAVGALWLIGARRRADHRLLALFVVFFLPIYVFSGFGNNALNPAGIDATGRYVLMLHSVLPVGLAWLVCRWRRVGLALGVAALTLNLAGNASLDPVRAFSSPYYVDQPAMLQPLIHLLGERGITHIWTHVGIAQVLMFETHERILAADYYDTYYAHGLVRFPDVVQAVAQADRVAYVELIRPDQTDSPVDRAFAAANVPYERLTPSPTVLVIIPRQPVDPAVVLPGLGFQY